MTRTKPVVQPRSAMEISDCVTTRRCIRRIAEGWQAHRKRVLTDPDYLPALSAVVLAAVQLVTDVVRAHRVARAITDAYVAIHRALSSETWPWKPDWD